MKTVTSVTIFNDAVGTRLSATYSEVDETTGKIISDNKRIDRVITDPAEQTNANSLFAYARTFVDGVDGLG